MSIEKRMKKRIQQIDANLNQIVKNPYEKKHRFPLWAKISIPVGSVVLASIVALSVILPLSQSKISNLQSHRLTTPKLAKISEVRNYDISSTTFNSYTSFAKKFASLMMEVNNKDKEESLGISIPDAYLCLAITGVISTDEARNDVLSYLELKDMDELRTSVKEIVSTMGTLFKNKDDKLVGGYNLNSVWFNPEKVSLIKEKDEELYKDLEEVFDASLYLEALTSDTANQYLKENGLKDMPVPDIKLNDDNPSAINVMSTYYCLDYFPEETKQTYLNQYKSGNHKMDYTYGNNTSKVDYLTQIYDGGSVYENDNFYGSRMSIGGNLSMSYFLPNDKNALPSSIFDDVLNNNYHQKQSSYYDRENQLQDTFAHKVTINAPYFSLDNAAELNRGDLSKILPIITKRGAGERIAKANSGYEMCLDYLKQFSVMKFNYDGFYSCSVTISGMEATSAPWYPEYEEFVLTLDHPYVFEVEKNVLVDGSIAASKVPLVVGEIVNPNYSD